MKKLTKSQLATISRRLDNIFDLATEEEVKAGLCWYETANEFCVKTAAKYGTTPEIVAGVVSALSPRNNWRQNLKDAETVLAAVYCGVSAQDVKVCTFNTNKFKAFAIANGKQTITAESPKTFSFVGNVGHLDAARVTVDVWHLRACFGKTIRSSVGLLAYAQLERMTIRKATKMGITGYQLQAIIWLVTQRTFVGEK